MIETITDIEEVVRVVMFRNKELSNQVFELAAENTSLAAENTSLAAENVKLTAEVKKLSERLLQYDKPLKDSHNSSTPPSKENIKSQVVRRTRSLRPPGVRHTGGQPGHAGATLLMRDRPDIIETHTPDYCSRCGLFSASE